MDGISAQESFRRKSRSQWLTVAILVFIVLFLDQALKFWVKLNMEYHQEIFLFGWEKVRFHFVENRGAAFGEELPGENGKLWLSLFRLTAIVLLIVYLKHLIRKRERGGMVVGFSLILAGAMGNIIDSALYGLIFSESPYHGGLAQFMPEGGGYAGFLHGEVVDMFYIPFYQGTLPEWIPFIEPGKIYNLVSPVFNVADMAIMMGVIYLLIFNKSFLRINNTKMQVDTTEVLPLVEDIGSQQKAPQDSTIKDV